ncbi:MAG: preQ(1) synthase [bacterium]|nr:preQ(1) synthase [bacterium]
MGHQAELLEVFENPKPGRRYTIKFTYPECTSVCPLTGQPDFGTVVVRYVPADWCVELKSLRLYFLSYRNEGAFFETVTNQILDDLVAVCDPDEMTVIGQFNARGGVHHEITATHVKGEQAS